MLRTQTLSLSYLFDPLHSRCYAVAPTIRALAKRPDLSLSLLPTGLFAGEGARQTTRDYAARVWKSDREIMTLTGRPFSNAYRRDVLGGRNLAFDSGPATLALTAFAMERPSFELNYLDVLQIARFIEGRDITSPRVLGEIATTLGMDGEQLAVRLAERSDLIAQTSRRMHEARRLMDLYGLAGVPAIIAHGEEGDHVIGAAVLLSDVQDVIDAVRQAA
jgi:putative protein-disulfide isomerase